MSVEVLTKPTDNTQARNELRRRALDFVTPRFTKILHKTGLISGVNVGDARKSWDVLKTLEFIEQHVLRSAPILDVGAYGSEVPCGLHKMGFSNLTGIDLNPALAKMPFNKTIKYVTGDFTSTSFPAETFGAITAVSVIEHGFCAAKIFREISRILNINGFFIGSTDYWPDKIDTEGVMVFGMDWTIFSKAELQAFVAEGAHYGLIPVGSPKFEASEKIVSCLGREYTFAWFAFKKVGPAWL